MLPPEIARDFNLFVSALRRMPAKPIEQTIFDQALVFHLAAKRCAEPKHLSDGRIQIAGPPIISNLAFACELYFKAILAAGGTRAKGHSLISLSNRLGSNARAVISESYSARSGRSPQDYAVDLSALSEAFVDWRYLYEQNERPIIMPHLAALSATLLAYCRTNFSGWITDVSLLEDVEAAMPEDILYMIYVGGGRLMRWRGTT